MKFRGEIRIFTAVVLSVWAIAAFAEENDTVTFIQPLLEDTVVIEQNADIDTVAILEENEITPDTQATEIQLPDSLSAAMRKANKKMMKKLAKDTMKFVPFVPDPNKTLWYALAFPGLGQIYNRSYWKLPIVYAGVAGAAFAITRFSIRYNNYLRGYQELLDSDPNTNYHLELLPEGYPESSARTYITNQMNTYRRYRDYAIVAGVAVYALQFIEAYVDALLRGFEVSPDLSMRVKPSFNQTPFCNTPAVGGAIELRF